MLGLERSIWMRSNFHLSSRVGLIGGPPRNFALLFDKKHNVIWRIEYTKVVM